MDTAYRAFCNRLEVLLDHHDSKIDPSEDLLIRQRRQLMNLMSLETEYRNSLPIEVFEDFITYITVERRNILAARPFFRERSDTFVAYLSDAFKTHNANTIRQFHLNWSFIEWATRTHPTPDRKKLARQISKQRTEILEQNLPFAISQARQFWKATPRSHPSFMDILQIQCQGLLLATDKFVGPDESTMSHKDAMHAWKSFRAVAIGIMRRDRVNHYSIDEDVILTTCNQQQKKIKDFVPGDFIFGVNAQGQTIETQVIALHDHGLLEGYEVVFDDGYKIVCSQDHKFLTLNGMIALKNLGPLGVLCEPAIQDRWVATSLRTDVSDTKSCDSSQHGVSRVSAVSDSSPESEVSALCASPSRGLEDAVRSNISVSGEARGTPQNLPHLCGVDKEQSLASGRMGQMGQGQPPRDIGVDQNQKRKVLAGIGDGPGEKTQGYRHSSGRNNQVAKGPSTTISGEYGEGQEQKESIQNGSGSTEDSGMAVGTDSLRSRAQAGGPCESRPQNMDRSGWGVSFCRISDEESQEGPPDDDSVSRCHSEHRSSQASGCDVDSSGWELLLRQGMQADVEVASLADSYAPLASTGSLVLRKVVRIDPVGFKHMYDIEVSHPKHNFILPNGVITSNSETMLHFYPTDKLKQYRANKLLRRNNGEIDYDKLASDINAHINNPKITTSRDEIRSLLSAASTMSADWCPDPDGDPIVDSHPDNSDSRPDAICEGSESLRVMYEAIADLSLRERKLLRMKGVHAV
jgi:hypothetical protein